MELIELKDTVILYEDEEAEVLECPIRFDKLEILLNPEGWLPVRDATNQYLLGKMLKVRQDGNKVVGDMLILSHIIFDGKFPASVLNYDRNSGKAVLCYVGLYPNPNIDERIGPLRDPRIPLPALPATPKKPTGTVEAAVAKFENISNFNGTPLTDIEQKREEFDCVRYFDNTAIAVAGRPEVTPNEHIRRCETILAEEQAKPIPNNFLIAMLCDSIRYVREISATDEVIGDQLEDFVSSVKCPNDPTHKLSWRGFHCEVCGIYIKDPSPRVGTNYVADDTTYPQRVSFDNNRVVEIAEENGKYFLRVGWK